MKQIISQNQLFERYEMPIDEAIAKYRGTDEYRTENLEKLRDTGETTVSFYRNTMNGNTMFDNLCTGPHIDRTNELDANAFKLERIA